MSDFTLTDMEEKIRPDDLTLTTKGGDPCPWPEMVEKGWLKEFVWLVRVVAASGRNGMYIQVPSAVHRGAKLPWPWNAFVNQHGDTALVWLAFEFQDGFLGGRQIWVPSYESIIRQAKHKITSPAELSS